MGVLVASERRYREIRGSLFATTLGLNLFTTLLPLLVGLAASDRFSSSRSASTFFIQEFDLQGAAAQAMQQAVGSASQAAQTATVLGLVGMVVSGVPLAGVLARAFALA